MSTKIETPGHVEVVGDKDRNTKQDVVTSCACSSCCLTGCLVPIAIIVLIWIGISLARIAKNRTQPPTEPTTEQVQTNE